MKRVSLPETPEDMAISKDNRWLATVGGHSVTRVELNDFTTKTFTLPDDLQTNYEWRLTSVTFGHGDSMFLATQNVRVTAWGWIYYVKPYGDTLTILKKFGQAVRRERKRRGLSQEDLGFEAELDRTYISSVERGRRNISLVNIYRIAHALKVRPRDLVQ